MKFYNYILFFSTLSVYGYSQTFEIYKGDTINIMDKNNRKQGWWRITGKIKPPGTCYKSDQLAEEGIYFNNRKTGLWIEYFCNGNKKNVLVFKDGRPGGSATMYFENGVVSETGNWKNNRWIGSHKAYDTLGFLIQEIEFDSLGKRQGIKMDVIDNAYEPSYYKLNDNFDFKLYRKHQELIEFRKTEQTKKLPIESPINHTILNGKQTLYNKSKQITKDGIFKDNRFIDGKAYIYNDNGTLYLIANYKDGKYVGDEPIKE